MLLKQVILGNWKMNQTLASIDQFIEELEKAHIEKADLIFGIAPQAVHIPRLTQAKRQIPSLRVGAQNCSSHESGAFTGELSPQTLQEIGVDFVLLGHSERRSLFYEKDERINQKVQAAIKHNLLAVLCIGETLEERESGKTSEIVLRQLKAGLKDVQLKDSSQIIIAYEPVWAIGTGKTASSSQAQEVHAILRDELISLFQELGSEIRIIYGGSVKPDNAQELLSQNDINGALVGGASLNAHDFIKICQTTK